MAQAAGVETEIQILKDNAGPGPMEDDIEEENIVVNIEANMENGVQDPYDTFMRRHLQHYGYFTGRNASFRNNYDGLENWHRNYDLRLSGTQNLSVDDDQMRKMGHYHQHKTNNHVDLGFGQFFAEGQPPDELLSRTTQLVFHYQAGKKIPKLREPRNLYALTKEPGPQQATRWPSHMQVVCSPIHFIDYIPSVPDPFYIPTGKEPTPAVRGTPSGEIVYLNDPGRDVYFMRSRVAGCRLAMRDISLTPRETVDEGNFTLEFESRFESGNLLKAVKINDFDYELTLRPDLYTDKHTQWYFFRVRNMVPNETYRFTIVNLMKPSSLYNNGMKPLFYSETDAKKSKTGWTRAGSDIRYYRNNLHSMSGKTFYSLTWTIQFPHKDDTCFFAHCYPYTYTDLQEYLLKLANDPVRSRICKQRVLCRTLAGNLVYILTVTSPSRNPEIARSKKAVVLTARVHPGETNASWMMKGFLDFLSGNSADAKLLRDNFIFKIVPMLNPDGVIVGNYRCSLAGRDLNRNYKSVLKDSFPSVYHVKMMIKKLNMEREVILYCDLHGHSRKNNIFIYGCENKNNPQRKLKERIFPLMLAKNSDTKFSYESCKFKVQKSKEGTGRVVMWCMGIMNSYTMEATFGGTSLGSRKGTHFSTRDLEEMGHNFCDTLLDYCDPDTSKVEACYQEIQDRVKKQILRRMQMRNMNGAIGDVDIDDYSSEYESDTSGSDSSCDDGLPVHLLAIAPKLQRKRRLKTRRDRNKQVSRKSSAPAVEESKPTPSHGTRVIEKPPKPIRYSQTAGNKRREDNPTVSVGTTAQNPGFHQEDRTTKKSDYLEALTTAYIRSGVLMVPDKKNVSDYSMRYTNGLGQKQDSNLAVQFLANQLGDLTESGSDCETGPLMRNAACQWSPQPEFYSNIDSDNKPYDEETKEAVLAEEQYEILRRSALRRQLSPAQQRVLAQRHLVAVAQMQQRREQTQPAISSASDIRRNGGTPLKQHPNPFDEKAEPSGPSRAASRCASATYKQDSRKVSQSIHGRPSSHEPNVRAASEGAFTAADKSSVHASDTAIPIKKAFSVPLSTETSTKDEELSGRELSKQTVKNSPKSVKNQSKTIDNNEPTLASNFFSSKPMHTPSGGESTKGVISPDSKAVPEKKHPQDDQNKGQSILIFGSTENQVKKLTPADTAVSEDFLPARDVLMQHAPYSKNARTNKGSKKDLFTKGKSSSHNPVFGESLGPLPEKGLMQSPSPEQKSTSPQNRDRTKSRSYASELSEDSMGPGEISLEKIPQQWGGKKQLVTLDVRADNSLEPTKRERPRILSAKKNKNALSNVIAEGHSSRFRAKNYQGSGDGESYFGMSDNVGPTSMRQGERVPPVVANITELRRSLMGHGREVKEDEFSAKGSPPTQAKQKTNQLSEEEKIAKRRFVNLRPRAQPRLPDSVLEENEDKDFNYAVVDPKSETDIRLSEHKESMLQNTDSLTPRSQENHGKRERPNHHHRWNRPPNLRHHEHTLGKVAEQQNASDVEDYVEEKWPTPNESEIRRYSQGNATIEKLSDHHLTSIRFGSRTSEHNKRLREQWIDVHQRQVISTVTPRQDMLAMSSVSLNIEGDDKQCVTTPALAKRPVPPLLRYLSAKQTTKRKW